MKILITTDWYEPIVNGVVTSIRNLKTELTRRGHDVRILTLSASMRSRPGIDITSIGSLNIQFIYPGARLRIAPAVKVQKELEMWHPDIIHSQFELNSFIVARHIARHLNIPIIHTYHTIYEDYTHYFSPSRRLGKKIISNATKAFSKKCDCMIAPSEKVKDILLRYKVHVPIEVIPTGIDLEKFSGTLTKAEKDKILSKHGIPLNSNIAVYVGRLGKEKNISEILGYWKSMEGSNWKLVIVGNGPYREELESECKALGLTSVYFTGMISPTDVPKYYKLGDVFVTASTSETQGLTYYEALASGVPLLCRKDRCLDGVVTNGCNGYQYEGYNDFVDHLHKFEDDNVRNILSENALETSVKFGIPEFGGTVEKLYKKYLY